jgi:hypothetical protein
MSHSSTCTGCPQCNSVFAALVTAPVREQAQFQTLKSEVEARQSALRVASRRSAPAPALTVAAAPPAPPEVPSLVDAIRAKAGGAPIPAAPIFGGGPIPRALAANRPADGVDDPPSLIDTLAANHADAVRLRRRK